MQISKVDGSAPLITSLLLTCLPGDFWQGSNMHCNDKYYVYLGSLKDVVGSAVLTTRILGITCKMRMECFCCRLA